MSDNYVNPILAEDFDPDGPAPNVDYSKMKLIDLRSDKIIKQPNENGEIVLTVEEKALLDPSPARLAYNKAKKEGATEEEARAIAEEVAIARREEEEKKLQDKE